MGFLRRIMERIDNWLADRCPGCGSTEVQIIGADVQENRIDFRCKSCGYTWSED